MKMKTLLLWSGQILLALFFAYAGWMKLSLSTDALAATGWHWAAEVPPAFVTAIGVLEILGALGIILPAATGILPWLTTLAAAGMVLLQLAATALHLARGEVSVLWLNAVILLLAGAVMVTRMRDKG